MKNRKNRKQDGSGIRKRRIFRTAAFAAAFSLLAAGTVFGEETMETEKLSEGNTAEAEIPSLRGWQDLEGEWYYYGDDGERLCGWQNIGNLRYHFEPDGKLSYGWEHYTGPEGDFWYFYDKSGNAVVRWLYDEEKWYWFNGDGTLFMGPEKEIGSTTYYFMEDGSLLAHCYDGFSYYNPDGIREPMYDVRAVDKNGNEIAADGAAMAGKIAEEVKAQIAEELNDLPRGWLTRFLNRGWTFLYCPEDGVFQSVPYTGREDWHEGKNAAYEIRHQLDETGFTLRFSDPAAIKPAFGEFIYGIAKKEFPHAELDKNLKARQYRVMELTGLPEEFARDYKTQFGAMFAAYYEEEKKAAMKERMDGLSWAVEEVIYSLDADGQVK